VFAAVADGVDLPHRVREGGGPMMVVALDDERKALTLLCYDGDDELSGWD
jgi:hypothetical protein